MYASKFSHEFEDSGGYGWSYETEPKHDWSTLIANKNAELQRLTGIYKNILNNAGVTLIEGRGKVGDILDLPNVLIYVLEVPDCLCACTFVQIVDPHTVDVNGKLYSAKNILISVGGRPFIPDIPGSECVIDSDAALDLPSRPKKIAIVGGGYIAVEFAGIFNGLKSDVHIFIRQKKLLRGFDEEVAAMKSHPLTELNGVLLNISCVYVRNFSFFLQIRDFLGEQMSLRGIEFHTEETPEAIVKSSDGLLSVKTNKGTVDGFTHVMFATGRRPNTKVEVSCLLSLGYVVVNFITHAYMACGGFFSGQFHWLLYPFFCV